MMRYSQFFLLLCFCCCGWAMSQIQMQAAEEQGQLVAFVVGNGSYKAMPHLPSAVADAQRVARLLKSAGFVMVGSKDASGSGAALNLTRQEWCESLQRLRGMGSLKRAHVVVFYYAGHGGQVGDAAYLMGTDASVEKSEQASDIGKFGINLEHAIEDLKPSSGRGLIAIMDACLSGPASNKTPRYDDRVVSAFSTSANNQAANGKDGQSSLYTTTLTNALAASVSFGEALKQAHDACAAAGYEPRFMYDPTNKLNTFRLPTPTQSFAAAPTMVQRTPPPTYSPQQPAMTAASGAPAWLSLTSAVTDTLTLRPTADTSGKAGEITQHGNGQAVAFCQPSGIVEKNGTQWIPVTCEGWALSKNLTSNKDFLVRHGGTFTVLGEVLKVRTDPKRDAGSNFKLSPKAEGELIDEVTVTDGYEWQRIRYRGWVTLQGPSGKVYATYQEIPAQ